MRRILINLILALIILVLAGTGTKVLEPANAATRASRQSILLAAVGTFRWHDAESPGTAFIVASRPLPDGTIGRGFDVRGPAGWNTERPLRLSARFGCICDRFQETGFGIWFYALPGIAPVAGTFHVGTSLRGEPVVTAASLAELQVMPRPIVEVSTTPSALLANWPEVPGATSYVVRFVGPLGTRPIDSSAPQRTLFTDQTSLQVPVEGLGPGRHRLQLFALSLDPTDFPESADARLMVSWTVSDEFTIP